ncbi:MAG: hypothetical protein KDE27_14345 [Planctomycetes bacterium]|nr:hypothetical protein [Planctomycetota bacterium]
MLRLSLVAALAAGLAAQSIVVPNANATASSTGVLNNPLRNSGNPRTYMMGINAAELAGIPVGALINGISMRAGHTNSNVAVWPANDVTFSDYEIRIGDVLPLASWTTTFLSNFVGTPTLARDGAMVVQTGAFTNNVAYPGANEWGTFYWDFQTPLVYTGGDLGVQFTHPGSNDPTSIFFEQVPSDVNTHGIAMTGIAFQAPTATSTSYVFCVIRIHYGYGPVTGCPGTGGLSPNLVQSENTVGGGTIHLQAANAPAGAPALYVWGLGRQTITLQNGCDLLTNPVASTFTLLDQNGRADLQLQVPPAVTAMFNVQMFVIDAGAPGGFTLSNGVEPQAF